MAEHTKGPWAIPVANVFRVIAPEAPHENKKSGMCPPYPWAIVCDTDPESVGSGEQAAANARLIAAAPDLLDALREVSNAYGCFAGCTASLSGPETRDWKHTVACSQARAALAKATKPEAP